MTGYHIQIGYNSTLNATEKRGAFQTLKVVVETLRVPAFIVTEALRENPPYSTERLFEYAQSYVPSDAQDLTLNIIKPSSDEDGQVVQLASGGGEGRDIKELLRRAFSRLVIFEMHRQGIEVNLVVA